MSDAIQAGDTFNVVVFGNEGRAIELPFDVETHELRIHVGYQCIVGRNNLQLHIEMRRSEDEVTVQNNDRYHLIQRCWSSSVV